MLMYVFMCMQMFFTTVCMCVFHHTVNLLFFFFFEWVSSVVSCQGLSVCVCVDGYVLDGCDSLLLVSLCVKTFKKM